MRKYVCGSATALNVAQPHKAEAEIQIAVIIVQPQQQVSGLLVLFRSLGLVPIKRMTHTASLQAPRIGSIRSYTVHMTGSRQ